MRRRLTVAVLLPEPVSTEVQGLRRALGDPSLDRIPPHITLVPPVNVNESDLPAALDLARSAAAAAAHEPVQLSIGPVSTFEHEKPVSYLRVEGGALDSLHSTLLTDPWHVESKRPFVPHVTIGRGHINTESVVYRHQVVVDRLHVLESDDERIWHPIADAPFDRPVAVGRGGVEIEFIASTLLDPVSSRLLSRAPGRSDLVVVARRDGESVGLATSIRDGSRIVLNAFVVREDQRGTGIARKLLEQFTYNCRLLGASEVVSKCTPSAAFLLRHGYEEGRNRRPTLFLNTD